MKVFLVILPVFALLLAVPIIPESFTQEDLIVLETGLISTSSNDYEISGKFDIRVIGDGDFIRMKGVTVSGYPYYVYQKMIDNEPITYGKIFIDGKAVPVVHKFQEPIIEEASNPEESTQKDLLISIQHPGYGYYTQDYSIVAKVFDAQQNTLGTFNSKVGILTGADIKVILTDPNGKIINTLQGKTDSQGVFSGKYFWKYGDAIGAYNVTVVADDGTSKVTKQFETLYNGYHPYYSGSDNP